MSTSTSNPVVSTAYNQGRSVNSLFLIGSLYMIPLVAQLDRIQQRQYASITTPFEGIRRSTDTDFQLLNCLPSHRCDKPLSGGIQPHPLDRYLSL